MHRKLITRAFLLYISAFSAHAEQILLPAADRFPLAVEYFEPESAQKRGVLLLHQCNFDQSMYQEIGQQLSDQGVHGLSLDFRGYGKSVNEQFDIAKLNAADEAEQQEALAQLYSHWPSDVTQVIEFLRHKVGESGRIGVVGASCGGSLALRLSDQIEFSSLALFSSAQGDKNIKRYETNLKHVPTYLIAAEEDAAVYESSQKIFSLSTHQASKQVTYKGAGHGYVLYEQDTGLQKDLVSWLLQNL